MTEDSDTARRLRPKERRIYTDEDVDEDDIYGKRKFCVEEKLLTGRYGARFVKELRGEDLTVRYFQEHGLTMPIVIKEKSGLGMRVPSENFKVSDVKQCVGSRRQLDVMDVTTQKGLEMSMKDWVRYYDNPHRERLLNVISLEFSHTRLENYVEQPSVVRDLDWVENAWPRFLKDSQTECTNIIEKMKYPKVQKYCLMSVRGCYTDFHIDMGGTSVWYHILHGCKTFWLIPPTERNLQLYEMWVLSGKQGDMFFGDKVEKCQRIDLQQGWTFFIPTGWIHAVFTQEDSLVFGGNFLHSLNIPMQLRIAEVEDKTKVPQKFRYPFFYELHWYLLDQYLNCLTGKSYRLKCDEEMAEEADDKLKAACEDLMEDTLTGSLDEDRDEGLSPQRSPMEDSHMANSPRPTRPSSPRCGSGSRKSNEENTAPKSPKVARSPRSASESPTPGAARPTSAARSDGRRATDVSPSSSSFSSASTTTATVSMTAAGSSSSTGNGTSCSGGGDPPAKRRAEAEIKTYFHQTELIIRPVSVKLENCMLTADRTLLEAATSANSTVLSPATSGGWGAVGSGSVGRGASWQHLTPWELKGLRVLVKWLEDLPANKRNLPKDIVDHELLLRDIMRLLLDHSADDPVCALTGKMILRWPQRKTKKTRHTSYVPRGLKGPRKKDKDGVPPGALKVKEVKDVKEVKELKERERDKEREAAAAIRRRRVRCKVCEACTRGDCRECHFCMDMKKYGGAGKMKQSCKSRQCMMPVLPTSAVCSVCGKDERVKMEGCAEPVTSLMECGICWDIVHPECMLHASPDLANDGSINEDLPNSWECPRCCGDCRQGQNKMRTAEEHARSTAPRGGGGGRRSGLVGGDGGGGAGRPSAAAVRRTSRGRERGRRSRRPGYPTDSSDVSGTDDFEDEEEDDGERGDLRDDYVGIAREEEEDVMADDDTRSATSSKDGSPLRMRGRGGASSMTGDDDLSSIDGASVSSRKRKELMTPKMAAAPVKQMKVALQRYAVRPAPLPPPPRYTPSSMGGNHPLEQELWMLIFQYLAPRDLCACLRVCRTWNRWCIDRRLWSFINLSRRRITRDVLVGTVRRQPTRLDISWTNLNRKQLEWLVSRLPQLKHLSLAGNSWAAVCALCSSCCPLLHSLDLCWVSGVRDACLADLVSPPTDHRPGVDDSVSRLHRLTQLELAGCDITDASLPLMTKYMPRLASLNLSYCTKVTDEGLAALAADGAPARRQLRHLDVTGCNQLTDACLDSLRRLEALSRVSLEACPSVTSAACRQFASQTAAHLRLVVKHDKYMEVEC